MILPKNPRGLFSPVLASLIKALVSAETVLPLLASLIFAKVYPTAGWGGARPRGRSLGPGGGPGPLFLKRSLGFI